MSCYILLTLLCIQLLSLSRNELDNSYTFRDFAENFEQNSNDWTLINY